MTARFTFVFAAIFGVTGSSAFLSGAYSRRDPITDLGMIGGRGWDNNDYLSSLSGDEEDRKNSQEDYQEFSDRRAAFQARQEEIMKTPRAQAFLKQRQQQQQQQHEQEGRLASPDNDGMGAFGYDDGADLFVEESSGGGTRMGRMMAQAKRMQDPRYGPSNTVGGFHQQLLGPLDDEDENEEIE